MQSARAMTRLGIFIVVSTSAFLVWAPPAFAEEPVAVPLEQPQPADEHGPAAASAAQPAPVAGAIPMPPPPAARAAHVQEPAVAPSEPEERRSVPLMATGIALTSVGALGFSFLGATAMGDCVDDCKTRDNIARATVIGAVVALAVGIPLLVYGAKRVPATSERSQGPLPKWAGAPSAAGWGWTL
jgi:hypothetical protein